MSEMREEPIEGGQETGYILDITLHDIIRNIGFSAVTKQTINRTNE